MSLPKIIFITESGPLPFTDGKRQRTYALIAALSKRFLVDVLILGDDRAFKLAKTNHINSNVRFLFLPTPPTTWYQLIYKVVGYSLFSDKRLRTGIANLLKQADYRFIFSRYIGPVAHVPAGVKVVCDIDDDFHEILKTKIAMTTNLWKKIRLFQIYLTNVFAYSGLMKRVDKRIVVRRNNSAHDLYLPNLPFQSVIGGAPEFVGCKVRNILFVGKLSYQPNAEGLLWFMKEVWPLMRNEHSIKLYIVSSAESNSAELSKLIHDSPQVANLGKVNFLEEVYNKCSVIIAPVFQGSGTSIKIGEALLYGRPVVTNNFGARGYEEALHLGYIISTDSASVFAGGIAGLFADDKTLLEKQHTISSWANRHFCLNKWDNTICDFLKYE